MTTTADNYLLVPMLLDVMVITSDGIAQQPFLRFTMKYENLSKFQSAEPDPFDPNSQQAPIPGTYLHWTLPKSLRHAIRQTDPVTGAAISTFPVVPNRWLVTRVQCDAPAAPAVKAWIIESDYVGAAGVSQGTSAYYDSVPKTIGRHRVMDVSIGPLTGKKQVQLQAVAAGTATFSVYAPGVEDVFAFTDDMMDANQTMISSGTFTYSVAGWYSDPDTDDPLAATNVEWVSSDAAPGWYIIQATPTAQVVGALPLTPKPLLDWYVASSNAALPRKTLLTALSSGVYWNAQGVSPVPGKYPEDVKNNIKIAIGNTSVDALAALVSNYGANQAQADLLQAFQYGLLDTFDEPGTPDALKMAIRKHWYGSSSGGTRWTVTVPQRDSSNVSTTAPTLTDPQQVALAAYNIAQMEQDRQQRLLDSMQWNLYSLWWKYNYDATNHSNVPQMTPDQTAQYALHLGKGSSPNHTPIGNDPAAEDWYLYKVQAQQQLLSQCMATTAAAREALAPLLNGQRIKGIELPAFHSANDPVVLIAGLNRSSNFDPSDGLPCRLPSQCLTALTVGGTTYTTNASGGINISAKLPQVPDPNKILPDAVQVVLNETMLLSPWMFATYWQNDTTACPGSQTTPIDDPLLNAASSALAAVGIPLPMSTAGVNWKPNASGCAPLAASMQQWEQPWVPVLLDWQITVLKEPAYLDNSDQTACVFQQNNWKFNGSGYDWSGPTAPSSAPGTDYFDTNQLSMQLMGRTFITPHITFNLADQLADYVDKHKNRDPNLQNLLVDLEKQLESVQNQNLLSQRLSGMMAAMVERSYAQTPAPTSEIANMLGDLHHGHPAPYPDLAQLGDTLWDFAPMSGTFFVINRLTVIDSFGRSVDLMLANNNSFGTGAGSATEEQSFYPIMSKAMSFSRPTAQPSGPSADATTRMMQLEPRLIQDSRLSVNLLCNDKAGADIYTVAEGNPVCGWLVPNHLDRSLAIYAPDGSALGELYLSMQPGGKYVPVWQPDPTNPLAPQSVDTIDNPYCKSMLQGISNVDSDGTGFYDFIKAVDETLWSINPRGQRKDQDLSVLIGRPLALVRAELSLKVSGLPFYNQDWNTFDMSGKVSRLLADDGGITAPQWPVAMGSPTLRNDGLVGYFFDDPVNGGNPAKDRTWSKFNAVVVPANAATSSYVQVISPANSLMLSFTDDTVTTPDATKNQVARVTMLVDPRGTVHAFSGLLPVAEVQVPDEFVTAALAAMSYVFRAGPFLTAPDAIRAPRPSQRTGTWTWFDNVINGTVPLQQSDDTARVPVISPLIKEGWLKLTPNPPTGSNNLSGIDESE